jgi:hypothetical protein
MFGGHAALNAICTTDSASHVKALRCGGGMSRKGEACTRRSFSSKDQEAGKKTHWRGWSGGNGPEAVKKKEKVFAATQEQQPRQGLAC